MSQQSVKTTMTQRLNLILITQLIIGSVKQKCQRKIIHRFKHVFGCSKEPSHKDGSFECLQHKFWLRQKKIFFRYAIFFGGLFIYNIRHYKDSS